MLPAMKRLGLLLLVGCSKTTTTLPDDFAGSYTHTSTQQFGLIQQETTDELTVSSTGMSEKSGDPMKMKGAVQLQGPGTLSMGTGEATSDLFTEVTCTAPTKCRFKTKQKCEGDIEKGADGALTIIANGACTDWSGSWKRDH